MSRRWILRPGDLPDVHVFAFAACGDDCRPVVVIDPEDREQVEQLLRTYVTTNGGRVNRMQAALRSLVADPKPEEPTGLGAVVEDDRQRQFVYFGNGCWVKTAPNAQMETRSWADIAAVKVLSEGVTS